MDLKNLAALLGVFLAFQQSADAVEKWFPDTLRAVATYIGISKDNTFLSQALIIICIAVIYLFANVMRSIAGSINRRIAYSDALTVVKVYRASRIAKGRWHQQIASAMQSFAGSVYWLIAYFIFDAMISAVHDDVVVYGVWKALQFFFLLIAGAGIIVVTLRLRPLRLSERQLRLHAEKRLREHFKKLGLPENDPNNPRNGINARISELCSGVPLRGLHYKYGRKGRRPFLLRITSGLFAKIVRVL